MTTGSSTIQAPTDVSSFAEMSQQMLSKYTEGRRLIEQGGLPDDDQKVVVAFEASLAIALVLRLAVDDFLLPELATEWHSRVDAMEMHLKGECTRA